MIIIVVTLLIWISKFQYLGKERKKTKKNKKTKTKKS